MVGNHHFHPLKNWFIGIILTPLERVKIKKTSEAKSLKGLEVGGSWSWFKEGLDEKSPASPNLLIQELVTCRNFHFFRHLSKGKQKKNMAAKLQSPKTTRVIFAGGE